MNHRRLLAGAAFVAALGLNATAHAAPASATPPPVSELGYTGCNPATAQPRTHPYYGDGWAMHCTDGSAFVVATFTYHRWAIIYGAFSDLAWSMPDWATALQREAAATSANRP